MQIQELNYPNNLYLYYQKLASLPGFALLQTADISQGRYDIVSAYPYEAIKINASDSNPLQQWEELTKELCSQDSAIDLPFQGGAIGTIAYDFANHLVGINKQVSTRPLVELNVYDWALITDHHLKKIFLLSVKANNKIIPEIISLWNGPIPELEHAELVSDFKPLISKQRYYQCFTAIQDALRAGRCYQVNYIQPFHARFTGDSWDLYQRISQQNPVPYAAFLRTSTTDHLSFSPERFLSYDAGQLISAPIKGTIRRSQDSVEDQILKEQLQTCPKNRAENTMIVDLMRNDLSKVAKTGTVTVPSLCAVHSFKYVHHLISEIHAQCLDAIHPLQAFLSCFPGGSITGAPKLESMQVISELESFNRGVYCGSIGYFSRHKRFDSNIAIRTIEANQGQLHLAAGGGVVIDSVCEDEYRECFTKIEAIVTACTNERPLAVV